MYAILQSILENIFTFLRDICRSTCSTYYILLILIFPISCNFFFEYNLLHTDVDSARYMLSALIQSEAAVIAVFVSLSMVAVQLTASSYSPRISEVFRKSPDLWLLLTSYICTIIYSLIVLKMIKEVNSEAIPEIHIIFSFSYGFFCFVALIPYTYNVLIMLKPSSIIKMLSKEINRENLFKEDPIYPIIEIMKKSIGRYDPETIQEGMKAITNKSSEIFNVEEFGIRELRFSAKLFEDHLYGLGYSAVEKGDQNFTNKLLSEICGLGFAAINQGYAATAGEAIKLIGAIGISACEHSLKWTTRYTIELLSNFFREIDASEQYQPSILNNMISIERAENLARSLEKIAEIAQANNWIEIASGARKKSEEIKKWIEDHYFFR